MEKYSLIIHGGAGRMAEFSKEKYERSLHSIIGEGKALLAKGKKALDVVERCVSLLEDDSLFNAGRGSVLNSHGKIEMDAAIMDGKTLRAGAVGAVSNIKNPVQLARKILEDGKHVLLAGDGALRFAKEKKVRLMLEKYFITSVRLEQWKQARGRQKYGTVGVVARDCFGNLAAATSTGGLTNKLPGRVGDTPMIGGGTFADNQTCAVSATGIGEHIMRFALAKEIAALIAFNGLDAQRAASRGIESFVKRIDGQAGVIVIDKNGRCGVAFSTPQIIYAVVERGRKGFCGITVK